MCIVSWEILAACDLVSLNGSFAWRILRGGSGNKEPSEAFIIIYPVL
jgi:hypothetical protein